LSTSLAHYHYARINNVDEAFANKKNTTIKFKWWYGREAADDDDNDDVDNGDGDISSSGERGRRGTRRRREEGILLHFSQ
jgi:hypothetical protein